MDYYEAVAAQPARPGQPMRERVPGVVARPHRDHGQHAGPPRPKIDCAERGPNRGRRGLEPGGLHGNRFVVVHSYPFTAPDESPPTTYFWNAIASSTGGTDAINPPAATSPKSVLYRPLKSAMATGIVFALFVEVKISA